MEDTPGQWPDCLETTAGNSEGGDWPQAPPAAASGRPPGLSMVLGGSGQRPELLSLWWGRGGAGGTGFALTPGPALPPPPRRFHWGEPLEPLPLEVHGEPREKEEQGKPGGLSGRCSGPRGIVGESQSTCSKLSELLPGGANTPAAGH